MIFNRYLSHAEVMDAFAEVGLNQLVTRQEGLGMDLFERMVHGMLCGVRTSSPTAFQVRLQEVMLLRGARRFHQVGRTTRGRLP